jgi:hypothetical protein
MKQVDCAALQRTAVEALTCAETTLKEALIGEDLVQHGWTTEIARSLADRCAQVRASLLSEERYSRARGDQGLGREIVEYVSGLRSDWDELQGVFYEAVEAVRRYAEECGV